MSRYDATQTNESTRSARIFKDLNLDFQQNSATKDIQKLTDVEAVKRSVRNLISTNHYEKPFHPEIGSGVRDILFENMTPISSFVLSKKIEDVIENFEPRAQLIGVRVNPNLDKNAYEVTVEFFVVNAPTEVVTQDLILEAIR